MQAGVGEVHHRTANSLSSSAKHQLFARAQQPAPLPSPSAAPSLLDHHHHHHRCRRSAALVSLVSVSRRSLSPRAAPFLPLCISPYLVSCCPLPASHALARRPGESGARVSLDPPATPTTGARCWRAAIVLCGLPSLRARPSDARRVVYTPLHQHLTCSLRLRVDSTTTSSTIPLSRNPLYHCFLPLAFTLSRPSVAFGTPFMLIDSTSPFFFSFLHECRSLSSPSSSKPTAPRATIFLPAVHTSRYTISILCMTVTTVA